MIFNCLNGYENSKGNHSFVLWEEHKLFFNIFWNKFLENIVMTTKPWQRAKLWKQIYYISHNNGNFKLMRRSEPVNRRQAFTVTYSRSCISPRFIVLPFHLSPFFYREKYTKGIHFRKERSKAWLSYLLVILCKKKVWEARRIRYWYEKDFKAFSACLPLNKQTGI